MKTRISLTCVIILTLSVTFHPTIAHAGDLSWPEDAFKQASRSADIAGYSLSKVHRWLHEKALKQIDPDTHLYRADGTWNYRDTAADCYPFFLWAAHLVDQDVLNGPVRDVLHAEIKLCNHIDRIPVPWDFSKNAKVADHPWDAVVFEASEYVKDGLIAMVEVTGKDEWFDRMLAIEEDLWKHAKIDTPFGKIPSTNIEVNGEQLQALARLYTMTDRPEFLEYAERLADYYLSQEDFIPTRLRDHGCEIIGGLGLLQAVESQRNPKKAEYYREKLQRVLDAVLEKGCNEDGMMFNHITRRDGGNGKFSDGWGYNYVGHLCYDMAVEKPRYRSKVAAMLKNLSKPIYKDYPWEGASTNVFSGAIDGFADSIEGCIYLLNRLPIPEGIAWADREMAVNVIEASAPLETGELWGTMKLQANGVRTVLMHAMMHTRGATARPWRRDLKLGAVQTGKNLTLVISAEKPYKGKLVFDIPRHKLYMGFKKDWPRMNTLPEWFTVEPDTRYSVANLTTESTSRQTGKALHKGLPIEIAAGQEIRLLITQ